MLVRQNASRLSGLQDDRKTDVLALTGGVLLWRRQCVLLYHWLNARIDLIPTLWLVSSRTM